MSVRELDVWVRRSAVNRCLDEVAAGVSKVRRQVRSFGAKHRNYRDLCERMATIMSEGC